MSNLDLELKILELEERNKYLKSEYDFLWERFKRMANTTIRQESEQGIEN